MLMVRSDQLIAGVSWHCKSEVDQYLFYDRHIL